MNLLTEDNLPHYLRTIVKHFGSNDVWREWYGRWTAEEGRHSMVIRDYLTVTRSVDLRALERARMQQVTRGVVPDPPGITDGIVYVALQELATRIAHRNTGKLLGDPAGAAIMSRVAADENLHHLYYRDLCTAALEIDPSAMVAAIDRQVRNFEMPGVGIPDFSRHARAIADAGVYDFAAHHDQILVPVVLKHWRIEQLQNLKAAAEQARERLMHHMERINTAAKRMLARRALAAPLPQSDSIGSPPASIDGAAGGPPDSSCAGSPEHDARRGAARADGHHRRGPSRAHPRPARRAPRGEPLRRLRDGPPLRPRGLGEARDDRGPRVQRARARRRRRGRALGAR